MNKEIAFLITKAKLFKIRNNIMKFLFKQENLIKTQIIAFNNKNFNKTAFNYDFIFLYFLLGGYCYFFNIIIHITIPIYIYITFKIIQKTNL